MKFCVASTGLIALHNLIYFGGACHALTYTDLDLQFGDGSNLRLPPGSA